MANLSMPPKKYAIPLAAITLVAAFVIYDPAAYLFLGVMAGVVILAVWLDRWIKRRTPADKFSFFHLWRIPDPAARGAIWLIAAFDGALIAVRTVAIFALLEMSSNLSLSVTGSLSATVAIAVMALATVGGYWRYRRRYDIIADTGGRILRYAGGRPLTFREKCGLAAAISGGIIAMPFAMLQWLSWVV